RPPVSPPFDLAYTPPAPHSLQPFPTRRSSDLLVLRKPSKTRTMLSKSTPVRKRGLLAVPFVLTAPALSTSSLTVIAGVKNTGLLDRKSTRLNSSHVSISYAVFCLKQKSQRFGR